MSSLSSRFAALNATSHKGPHVGAGRHAPIMPGQKGGAAAGGGGGGGATKGGPSGQRSAVKQARSEGARRASQAARLNRVNESRGIQKKGAAQNKTQLKATHKGGKNNAARSTAAVIQQKSKNGKNKGTSPSKTASAASAATPTGKGSSRRAKRRAGKGKSDDKSKKTPLSADTLDEDMEKYMLKDASTASNRLNDDLDAYMAAAKMDMEDIQ